MFDVSLAYVASAFIAGVLMFLAPCTLPIVPAFIASMMPEKRPQKFVREMLVRTISFTAGFSIIFLILGILTGIVGAALVDYKLLLTQIGAVCIIVLGSALLGLLQLPILTKSFQRLRMPGIKKGRVLRPALLGIVFALGWSPCAGPVLASILLLASQSNTALEGGILLGFFSLGLAVPFILVGALYAHVLAFFNLYSRYYRVITRISGLFLILLGVTLLFTQSLMFSTFGFALYEFFGIAPICTFY